MAWGESWGESQAARPFPPTFPPIHNAPPARPRAHKRATVPCSSDDAPQYSRMNLRKSKRWRSGAAHTAPPVAAQSSRRRRSTAAGTLHPYGVGTPICGAAAQAHARGERFRAWSATRRRRTFAVRCPIRSRSGLVTSICTCACARMFSLQGMGASAARILGSAV